MNQIFLEPILQETAETTRNLRLHFDQTDATHQTCAACGACAKEAAITPCLVCRLGRHRACSSQLFFSFRGHELFNAFAKVAGHDADSSELSARLHSVYDKLANVLLRDCVTKNACMLCCTLLSLKETGHAIKKVNQAAT